MKKFIKIAVTIVALILVLLLVAVVFFGGPLIKGVINSAGPRLLGVPVTLQDATFAPFQGKLALKGLHVGNPQGFKTAGLFELGLLDIDLDTASLLKNIVVIREIRIEGPEITYERALNQSNIGQLLDQLGSKTAAPATNQAAAAPPPKAEGGKKVVIQKLTITDAKVHASITALGGHAVLLPLPPIKLANIGGTGQEAKGVTFLEAIQNILGAIFNSVTDVVSGAGKLATDGVKAAGDAAKDSMKAVGTGAGKALEGVKNLFGLGGQKDQPASTNK